MENVKRTKINFFIDLFMAVSFFIVAIAGLVIFFFLPSGVIRGGYQEFLSLTKQTWVAVHNWFGIILIILMTIHLILHWNWIVTMTKKLIQRKDK